MSNDYLDEIADKCAVSRRQLTKSMSYKRDVRVRLGHGQKLIEFEEMFRLDT